MLKLFDIFVGQMNLTFSIVSRKIATVILITFSVAAFATLGDGGKKTVSTKNLLSNKAPYNFKNFSLKTGWLLLYFLTATCTLPSTNCIRVVTVAILMQFPIV